VLVPSDYIRRLGDGDYGRGKHWLDQLVNDMRRQRVAVDSAAGGGGAALT
jgi:hypothetical protein